MNPAITLTRQEVMLFLENDVNTVGSKFLNSIETNWQPGDLLPASHTESFFEDIKTIQGQAENMDYDLLSVLVGDTITEEALPTYETWLGALDGVKQNENGGWMKWIRAWTAEENRHGDLLNKYLYLSGRVDMRAMEISTQYLIHDGFDIQTQNDPYRTFVYTSFQELATNISHRRVAALAKQAGDKLMAKMCGVIAADEARHAKAYISLIKKAFEVDANQVMLAFEDMMKKKIVMPAHLLREIGLKVGQTFGHFTDAAQRTGVYTATDYVDIMKELLVEWQIESMRDLNEAGEKARDYVMALPDRLMRVADRMKNPHLEYKFSWIHA
jgi:acyl-[acyl-carrier-protein] desaturase